MRRFAERSKQPLENMTNSWPWSRNESLDGLAMSQGLLVWQRQSYRAQWKEKEKEADRRRGGKTISKSGQEWTLPPQLGQLKTGQDGKGLLQIHLWCPDDLPRLWDRIEIIVYIRSVLKRYQISLFDIIKSCMSLFLQAFKSKSKHAECILWQPIGQVSSIFSDGWKTRNYRLNYLATATLKYKEWVYHTYPKVFCYELKKVLECYTFLVLMATKVVPVNLNWKHVKFVEEISHKYTLMYTTLHA